MPNKAEAPRNFHGLDRMVWGCLLSNAPWILVGLIVGGYGILSSNRQSEQVYPSSRPAATRTSDDGNLPEPQQSQGRKTFFFGPGGVQHVTIDGDEQPKEQVQEAPQPVIPAEQPAAPTPSEGKEQVQNCQGYPAEIDCRYESCKIERILPPGEKFGKGLESIIFLNPNANAWVIKFVDTPEEARQVCAEQPKQ